MAAVLRVISCGSVDDGKSTLIGRLLHDAGKIMDDTLEKLEHDSRTFARSGGETDFALLLDGLKDEREQGITIDVAYRYFETPIRKIILADAPGHEQYTRNMASAASTADAAILLVDARKGIQLQTRRHAFILSLFGIRHVVLAVNKMDLLGHDERPFRAIHAEWMILADTLGFSSAAAIPMSARTGANVTRAADEMPWFEGLDLLAWLDSANPDDSRSDRPFRFPVQWINRPHLDFRGYAGTLAAGRIAVGDPIVVAQSGAASRIARIVTADADLPSASAGQAVTLVLRDEVDAPRGAVFCPPEGRPDVARQFCAHLLWLGEDALMPGRRYLLKAGPTVTQATVTALKHSIDMDSFALRPARTLAMNEIGLCNFDVTDALAFDAYEDSPDTGSFILVDRVTGKTVGAGMIQFALRRATNIHPQSMDVQQAQRSVLKGHQPAVLWFTGLSGAGKSTIANAVESALALRGCHTYALDGDNIRRGLNRDLGFTEADRVENVRRVAEVAALMADAGLIVTCAFISPFQSERQLARELTGADRFVEVFVDTPLETCIARDPKGLYARAQANEISNFTGFDSPYEAPEAPDITISTLSDSLTESTDRLLTMLEQRGIID